MQVGLRGRHDADPPRARPPLACSWRSSGWRSSAACSRCSSAPNRAPRWLNNRWTNWLGERSYAFYLLHVWVFFEIIHVVGADTDPVAARRDPVPRRLPDLGRPRGAVVAATSSDRASSGGCRGRRACAPTRRRTRSATRRRAATRQTEPAKAPVHEPASEWRRDPRPIDRARRAPERRARALRAVGAAPGRRAAPRRRAPRPRRAARRALLRAAAPRDPPRTATAPGR